MEIIEADHLSKSFGSFMAVDDVSIAVKEGEIFGFLGPNGAGKTTTIRMLTGVLTPDAGSARICGIDIHKNPLEAKMKMGIIPENGTVYSDLTAEQNILWTAKFYGMDSASRKKRADEILSDLGLSERRNDIVRNFSKGMRQRISIACAIVPSPPVLFLDEPTGGLDVYSRRLVIDTVRRMNDEGSTVFLTTHNIEEANELCTIISVINKGAIIATGSPEKLKKSFDKANYRDRVRTTGDQGIVCIGGNIPGRDPRGQVAAVYGRSGPDGEILCSPRGTGTLKNPLHCHIKPDP